MSQMLEEAAKVASPPNPTHPRPMLGLIALDRDEVVEHDLHSILENSITVMTTRIPLRKVGSAAHLIELTQHLAPAAERLTLRPPAAVAFACTSGGAVIGTDIIDACIHETRPDLAVVDPLRALQQGISLLGESRIALVTPYPEDITAALASWFGNVGVEVTRTVDLPRGYRHYAEIPPDVIAETATEAAAGVGVVVVACTDLYAVDAIAPFERATGKVMLTSNLALAWLAARALSVEGITGPGRLFAA